MIINPTSGAAPTIPTTKQSSFSMVLIISAVAALAGLLFGYDTGVISGAILFIKPQFQLSPTLEEIVVGAALIGAVIGAFGSGRLADHFGRRRLILVTAGIFVVASLCSALATSVSVLVAGRILIGVAIGVASFVAPLYISEIAPPERRGALVALNQLAITAGILLSYIVDTVLASSENWQMMIGIGVVPAVILGIGIYFLPESPRWLLAHKSRGEAEGALRQIRGQRSNATSINTELDSMEHAMSEAGNKKEGGWKELLSLRWVRPLLICGFGLAIFQQVTGINTVIYYAPTIFKFAGFQSAMGSILATAGVGVVNMLMTVVSILVLDRLGRRPLLMGGLIGMIISLFALGFGFYIGGEAMKWIGVCSLAVYIGSFAISLGPIFWLLIAEIYPLQVRGLAMSAATMVCWIANLAVSITFLTLIEALGRANTFWFYGALSVAALIFSYFYVPETKGISLEAIEEHCRARKPLRELGR